MNTVWRNILARLPLPMLALAASYGVYQFALLFVPFWVAVVQAAAFELTYIGLAVVQGLTNDQRQRATAISIGTVVVSIAYNTLAGLFHRNPGWLEQLPWAYEWGLAFLHAAPLAWVAYLVADLLLHSPTAHSAAAALQELLAVPVQDVQGMQAARIAVPAQAVQFPEPVQIAPTAPSEPPAVCPNCGASVNPNSLYRIRRRGYCSACKGA